MKIIGLILFILLTNAAIIFAKDSLNVQSEQLTLDRTQNSATFEGSVVVNFEDITLYSSILEVYYTDEKSSKREIKEIFIPAKLKAVRNCGEEIVFADSGHFDNLKKKLTLTGNVKMQKAGNTVFTKKLIYFTNVKTMDNPSSEK
jgi:lipopolysaccharide transport protein LptA